MCYTLVKLQTDNDNHMVCTDIYIIPRPVKSVSSLKYLTVMPSLLIVVVSGGQYAIHNDNDQLYEEQYPEQKMVNVTSW